MMFDHAPQSATAHTEQSAGRQDRHGRRQHQRQGLEQQPEAAPFTRPGHRNLRDLAATGTGHSRHLGTQMASYWKKSRWGQERARRSCSGCAAAPQAGQAWTAAPNLTWKSIRPDTGLKMTSLTYQGATRPRACVNSVSIMRKQPREERPPLSSMPRAADYLPRLRGSVSEEGAM